MKEKPILYSTPMAIAKREGRKTMTRRVVKPQPDNECYFLVEEETRDGVFGIWYNYNGFDDDEKFIACPWQVGDIFWGREAWTWEGSTKWDDVKPIGSFWFRANDLGDGTHPNKWKPSIHMPKIAAQIWERIIAVRVERLQDITEEDAVKEGAKYFPDIPHTFASGKPPRWSMIEINHCDSALFSAKWAFANFWDKLSAGQCMWDDNPWVWVIETEVLSTTGRPKDL